MALVPVFVLMYIASMSQPLTNFSGNWEFYKVKSSPQSDFSKYDGKIDRHISQTGSTLTYYDVYVKAGSADWKTTDEPFILDGCEHSTKFSSGTIKKFAKWSADKKMLTLTYITVYKDDGSPKEITVEESYGLSDNGNTLIINQRLKNQVTGETKHTLVFHKKADHGVI
jgi:hypothetical protein